MLPLGFRDDRHAMINRLMRRPAATVIGAAAGLFVLYEIEGAGTKRS